MATRKQEMTQEEYDSLTVYMKTRLEPVIIDSKVETKEEVKEEVVEVKKDEEGKLSYTDIKDMNKKEQVKILEEFGTEKKVIKQLKSEEDRIDAILELQKE